MKQEQIEIAIKAQQKIYESNLDFLQKAIMNCLIIKAFGNCEDVIYLSNEDILKGIGLSVTSTKSLRNARNKLVSLGYIEYERGYEGNKSKYMINWNNIIGNEPIIQIDEEETYFEVSSEI